MPSSPAQEKAKGSYTETLVFTQWADIATLTTTEGAGGARPARPGPPHMDSRALVRGGNQARDPGEGRAAQGKRHRGQGLPQDS